LGEIQQEHCEGNKLKFMQRYQPIERPILCLDDSSLPSHKSPQNLSKPNSPHIFRKAPPLKCWEYQMIVAVAMNMGHLAMKLSAPTRQTHSTNWKIYKRRRKNLQMMRQLLSRKASKGLWTTRSIPLSKQTISLNGFQMYFKMEPLKTPRSLR
jgi:hypothetical protein